jgi:hypothetical protein
MHGKYWCRGFYHSTQELNYFFAGCNSKIGQGLIQYMPSDFGIFFKRPRSAAQGEFSTALEFLAASGISALHSKHLTIPGQW